MKRRFATLAPTRDIVEVDQADGTRQLSRILQGLHEDEEDHSTRGIWQRYAWAVVSSVAITLFARPLHPFFDLANIVMLFLLGVVLVAIRYGRGPAALAACLNVATFDLFFVEPHFSLAVSDIQYLLTFFVMLVVGLITGQLTAGLRFQVRISRNRERRAQSLFELTRELSAALLSSQVVELGAAAVKRNFGGDALILTTDTLNELIIPDQTPADFDANVANWAFRNDQAAGLATGMLAAQIWHYMPLQAPIQVRGILALKPAQSRWLLISEQKQQLETLARQIAIALERVHYVEIAQRAVVEMETERLRNTLLAAISHDVRTPLTVLIGLAESLRFSQPSLTAPQTEMAKTLVEQAHQLNALVNNLLEMARLQSETVNLRMEWQSIEEVVGTAIRAARPALGGWEVQTVLPHDLPLVEFDATLIERVIVNLLENAAKYAALPIVIGAQITEDTLTVTVRDHGPGLPSALKGRENVLFEKFTRGQAESAKPGVGLGLAICKTVIDTHRGQICAVNAPGGGAEFSFTLPRNPPPVATE